MSWLSRLAVGRPIAALTITVVTIALIGGVLFSTTTIACGPALKAGMKLQQCARTVAGHVQPSPSFVGFPSSPAYNPYSPPASEPYQPPASEPYQPPASQPYYPPSSGYCPPDSGPYCPGSSGPYPPQGPGPASGSYPPFIPPSTAPGGLAVPGYSMSCRLPIYAGGSGSGGFIVFPGGNFIPDPTSAVTLPTPTAGSPPPQQTQPGNGVFYGLSYDSAAGTWLPVPYAWMTPDGAHYVFPSTDSIYVVEVRSKTVTQIGQGHSWRILGVVQDAVYAEANGEAGLWKLSFAGGSTELTTAGFWQGASASAAYGTETSAVPQGVTNTIIRFDFSTGKTNANYFTRDGTNSSLAGFDYQGDPVIQVSYFSVAATEIWVGAGQGTIPLFSSSYPNNLNLVGTPVGDSRGLWLPLYINYWNGNINGFALYLPANGLYWMSNIPGQLAGGCS